MEGVSSKTSTRPPSSFNGVENVKRFLYSRGGNYSLQPKKGDLGTGFSMSTPNGYNNPAYCHQFESSLYDYQYVPEIDPDSPDLRDESYKRFNQTRLVRPKVDDFPNDSSEGSDESNRSIIVEECNNRRVTLICEKRNKPETNKELYEDENFNGAYYQDISLESENGFDTREVRAYRSSRKNDGRRFCHDRNSKLTVENPGKNWSHTNVTNSDKKLGHNPSFKQSSSSINPHQRPQKYHRYEEIPSDEESQDESEPHVSVHRYAEITSDENGYPTLSKEIKIQQAKENYRQRESQPQKIFKPRAMSPINYPKSFSPPSTPSRTHQRFGLSPVSTSPIIYSSSPVKSNSFEMSELSPPRPETSRNNEQTFFIRSPKRQPPIGASAANDLREPYPVKCILPKNLQQISSKSGKRPQSLPNSPRKRITQASETKPQSEKKITQIFHIKKPKTISSKENTSVRRNISHAFNDQPSEHPRCAQTAARSPYKPTTAEIAPPRTAIITPIFQRKNQEQNFERTSQAFQSTGNIYRSAMSPPQQERIASPKRIKRNQSVPNFSHSLATESRMTRGREEQESQKYSRNLDLQYSPKKPIEHVTSMDKSRISLMDQTSSWSTLDSDYHRRCSTCFIFAALVHLVTASATCAISFYLLSKVGRKYYLDFGLLAGFVNFILGLLGFRSYCWRWLPNRNYVSGFIGLAAFSAFTCAGLTYLITARPMAGDPILDVMGGAICAVSVLTIVLAMTGLTMSGCCKAPPPDNRVTDI